MIPMGVPTDALALVHDPEKQVLSLKTLPVPQPAERDEHLVRVHSVALTNGELAWKEALALDNSIPGYEFAGTVEVAPAGSRFPRGTAVYARTSFDRPGSARPFSMALTSELGRKPRNLTWQEAATVPLSALSAWQALFVHGGLRVPNQQDTEARNSRKSVLVTAAAGGVGLWVVQLAKLAGAYVVGTCGPANLEFVASLGADEVMDYTQTTPAAWSLDNGHRKFDLVIDCVGGSTLREVWTCAAEGGTVISLALPADLKKPAGGLSENVRSHWFIVEADSQMLETIADLLEEEKVRAVYDSAFDLEDFQKAFEKVHSGHVTGKVVLNLPRTAE